MSEDLIVLREILQRELETINAYERMLERVSDPHLREIIDHVTDEEREHVSEMYQLIMERDPKQVARAKMSLEQLHPQVAQAGGSTAVVEAQTAAAAAGLPGGLLSVRPGPAAPRTLASDPTPPPPPIFPEGAWSVGSLKRGPTP
jgi:hypothetical protein